MSTRWTVRVADKLSSWIITIGGIGTIVAVSAVFVFLVVVVVPLFLPGSVTETGRVQPPLRSAHMLHFSVDEYRLVGWGFFRDGSLRAFRMDTAELLLEESIADADSLKAWSVAADGSIALGFADGSVRLGRVSFVTDYPAATELAPEEQPQDANEIATTRGGVVEHTPEDQLRRQRITVEIHDPIPAASAGAVALIDVAAGGNIFATLSVDGTLRVTRVEETENLMTGEIDYETTSGEASALGAGSDRRGLPSHLVVFPGGASAYLVWDDGSITVWDTRDLDAPTRVGSVKLLEAPARLSAFSMLLGGTTLLLGDDGGTVRTAFRYNPGEGEDGLHLAVSHRFEHEGASVRAIAGSPRGRIFAAGYSDGVVHMFQATSGAHILKFQVAAGVPVDGIAFAPKGDGAVVITRDGFHRYDVDPGHPEATLRSMFRPVWYEGYARPAHVWQSSSGTDDFEPKFGMWPLVFGTLKATFYSMLFGIPLALLAAIYTSEFLAPGLRSRIKTLIEAMASLPSVVLGFLAALVIAPFVQGYVPSVIVSFLTLPLALLVGAHLWQLLPTAAALRLAPWRIVVILAALGAGLAAASLLGRPLERSFFDGDLILWLDGQQGTGTAGWFFLLLPLSGLAVAALWNRLGASRYRAFAAGSDRRTVALAEMGRLLGGVVATLIISFAVSSLLNAGGVDSRGSGGMLGTYVQRNALVVGFVMGFAVIPLIYTIAEDALTAVPDHLRVASLGAGATPWQTAIRIVLPTAMSGLFSAVMIGLGRAVGETMIVLMAAGNTPILEMNIFNGFRTLSANIAVELPEAVRDSTHYQTLFLAALLLFAITFIINTVAETVRLRFRRRSSQI